jgi:hypothetical protein
MTTAIFVTSNAEGITRATLKVTSQSKPARVTKAVIVYARTMSATVLRTLTLLRRNSGTVSAITILFGTDIKFARISGPAKITIARIVETNPVTVTVGETGCVNRNCHFGAIDAQIARVT